MEQNEKINYLTKILVGMGEQFPEEIIDEAGILYLIDGAVDIIDIENMFEVENILDINVDDLEDYLRDNIPGEEDI
jgi:hypothetical protein